MSEMHKFIYEGPVLLFDQIIDHRWRGETWAVSEYKAKSNLAYQFKKQTNRSPGANIILIGKVRQVN